MSTFGKGSRGGEETAVPAVGGDHGMIGVSSLVQ